MTGLATGGESYGGGDYSRLLGGVPHGQDYTKLLGGSMAGGEYSKLLGGGPASQNSLYHSFMQNSYMSSQLNMSPHGHQAPIPNLPSSY